MLCIPTNVIATHLDTQCSTVLWNHYLNMEHSCRTNSSQKTWWAAPALFYSFNYLSSSFFFSASPFPFPKLNSLLLLLQVSFQALLLPTCFSVMQSKNPEAIVSKSSETSKVKVACGDLVSTFGSAELSFPLGGQNVTEQFIILPKNIPFYFEPSFFEKNNINFHPKTRTFSQ